MSASDAFVHALCVRRNPVSENTFFQQQAGLFLGDGDLNARIEVYDAPKSHERIARPIDKDEKQYWTTRTTSTSPKDDSRRPWPTANLRTPAEIEAYAKTSHSLQVYFIRQRNSYSALSVSQTLWETLVTARKVTDQFTDYIVHFGEREREVEVIPPPLKFRALSKTGRSDFECMYVVRFIDLNGRKANPSVPTARWSLRQSAIYSRASDTPDATTWLFVTLSKLSQERLDEYLALTPSPTIANVFEIHLLIMDTAIASWRSYIIDLAFETDAHAANVLGASPDNSGPMSMSDAGERQSLMVLDEKALNASLVVKATRDSIKALQAAYHAIHGESLASSILGDEIAHIMTEKMHELDILALRLDALRTRLKSIADLVSSFLDLSSGFALQELSKESRRENEEMRKLSERMHLLTEKGTQDAAAVKVLTILTLIYLPATVVSNFFSTSFVGTAGSDNHIVVSNDWWIFAASSVPLTLLTLYIWWVWMRVQAYHVYPWWWFKRRRDQLRDPFYGEKVMSPSIK